MQDISREKWNKTQTELHLKSAVDALTPNVLDKIDLSTPQDVVPRQEAGVDTKIMMWNHRMRGMALAAAACLCILVMGGGTLSYQYQNRKIDSVIGIDVNPSVELSINRKNKVLQADPLNDEAEALMADMDLKGVDLNVAVNAVIGSMVTHGYLDDLDNAILVTVSNDSIRKATALRTSVVGDIEKTLEENQVQAVVYDQQVIERDEMKQLAEAYGISYGKAYFLKELIEQNKELSLDDMEELSSLSMEEIARRITESSYALGEFAEKAEETTAPTTTAPQTTEETTTVPETETPAETTAPETTPAPTTVPETTPAPTTVPETIPEVEADRIEIDYVDYEDGQIYVYFVTKVKWKHPTVSIRDEDGNSYAAMVGDTTGDSCEVEADGLEGGRTYTFVLGGLTPVEGGKATTVQGYFDVPEIAGGATLPAEDETEETDETTTAPSTDVPEPTTPETTLPEIIETPEAPTTEPTTTGTAAETVPSFFICFPKTT